MPRPVVRVNLLGPLEAWLDDVRVEVRGRRPRTLLCLLALRAGSPVPVDALVDRIWGDELPVDPGGSLHTCVRRIREVLGREAVVRAAGGGYLLDVDPGQVDVARFLSAVGGADEVDESRRRDALADALSLWRGTPFEESLSPWLTDHEQPRLVESYLSAVERRVDLDLAAGRQREIVAELQQLVDRHPLREPLWARLLTSLDQLGRRAEALEAYDAVRSHLATELGVEPGAELQSLFARLLEERTSEVRAPGEAPPPSVPRQLPAGPQRLVGRDGLLAQLDSLVDDGGRLIVLHGAGGSGKTALAVDWARRRAERFPDGQLFVDLRGFSPGTAMSAGDALEVLLTGLGSAGTALPNGVAARTAMLRSKLADRRCLVVLDNARDIEQVRPLLPGGDSLVLVTSRNQLRGLVVRDGAAQVAVGTLSPQAAEAVLRSRLDGADEAGLDLLADLCGHLPLALSLAAERAARQPETHVEQLVAELGDHAGRLSAWRDPDDEFSDLRAVFSWSYRALDTDSARMFRLLGLHPHGNVGVPAAAALAGLPPADARLLLDRLSAASLVTADPVGGYALHDLLHEYAAELARDDASMDEAWRRLVAFYIHTAANAAGELRMGKLDRAVEIADPEPGVVPLDFADGGAGAAMSWFSAEWPTIRALVVSAVERGASGLATRLMYVTFSYRVYARPPAESAGLEEDVLQAVRTGTDKADEALISNCLAVSRAREGDLVRAETMFRTVLDLSRELGWTLLEGAAANNLGKLLSGGERAAEAIPPLERALEIARETANQAHVAERLRALSGALIGVGRPDEAIAAARQAVDVCFAGGSVHDQAGSLMDLAAAQEAAGDVDRAAASLARALALQEETADRWGAAVTGFRLGRLLLRAGDPVTARRHLEGCQATIDQIGLVDSTEFTRDDLNRLVRQSRHPD